MTIRSGETAPLATPEDLNTRALRLPPFYVARQQEIRELGRLAQLDLPDTDLSQLVAATQPWAQGDHFAPTHTAHLDESGREACVDIGQRLGMIDAWRAPAGQYDRVLILGGEQKSNDSRIDFALSQLTRSDVSLSEHGSIVTLGGERAYREREVPYIIEDHRRAIKRRPLDAWLRDKKSYKDIRTEDDMLRLALIARIGSMALRKEVQRPDGTGKISHRYFSSTAGPLLMVNAVPVVRPLGDKRHTTESTLAEWLAYDTVPVESKLLFISSNPYIERTTRNLRNILARLQRPDLRVEACGPAALIDNTVVERVLGEVARSIYEDQLDIKASQSDL